MAFGGLRTGTQPVGGNNSIPNPLPAAGSVVVSIGDLIVAVIAQQTALTVTAVTDNLGNTYTAQNAGTLSASTISGRMFYSRVTVAGTLTTVNAATTASANDASIAVAVFEGPFRATPLDLSPANLSADTTTPYSCPASGTLTQANELIIGWFAAASTATFTAGGGFTKVSSQSQSANAATAICSLVVSATTTQTPSWTGTAPSADVLGTASFFKDMGVAVGAASSGGAANAIGNWLALGGAQGSGTASGKMGATGAAAGAGASAGVAPSVRASVSWLEIEAVSAPLTGTATGAASGTGAAAAVGASTAASVGAALGTGAAAGAAPSAASIGAGSGSSAAAATGAAIASSVGSAAAGGPAAVYNKTLVGNASDTSGKTTVSVISKSYLAATPSGYARLTVVFQEVVSSGTTVQVYFGQQAASGDVYDFKATPVHVLFGGGDITTNGTLQTLVSDWFALPETFDNTKNYCCAVNWGTPSGGFIFPSRTSVGASVGDVFYSKSASADAATVDKTGYSIANNDTAGFVSLIEVQAAGGGAASGISAAASVGAASGTSTGSAAGVTVKSSVGSGTGGVFNTFVAEQIATPVVSLGGDLHGTTAVYVIPASRLEPNPGRSTNQAKITVKLVGNVGFTAQVYIGQAAATGDAYDFLNTPTHVTFSGGDIVADLTTQILTSDLITLPENWDSTKNYCVAVNWGGSGFITHYHTALTGDNWYIKGSSADATTVDKTGYTLNANDAAFVTKLEVQAIVGGVGAALFSAAGAASGTSTAAAVGQSTAASIGSASSVGKGTGIADVGTAVGAASGNGTAAASGVALFSGVGNASGTGSAAAIGQSPAVGAASGNGKGAAVSAATAASVGAAASVGTAAATGAATFASVGSGAGIGTANGPNAQVNVGAAFGNGTANAISQATAASVGAAASVSTGAGVGQALGVSVGAASGVGAAAGKGQTLSLSAGAASSNGAATGNGVALFSGVGASTSTTTAAATSQSIAASVGAASSVGTANGPNGVQYVGAASGNGSAAAVGQSTVAAVGAAAGTSTAAANATSPAVGAAFGNGTAAAQGVAQVQAKGAALSVSTANAPGIGAGVGTGGARGTATAAATSRVIWAAFGSAAGIGTGTGAGHQIGTSTRRHPTTGVGRNGAGDTRPGQGSDQRPSPQWVGDKFGGRRVA